MQGPTHAGFALAGAAVVNTVLYRIAPPVPNQVTDVVHALGPPITLSQFLSYWHTGLLVSTVILAAVIYKLIFYVLLVRFANTPNRWEKAGGASPGSRGPLHSCFFVILLAAALFLAHLWLRDNNPLGLNTFLSFPIIQRLVWIVILAFLLAFVFHIIADGLTPKGIPPAWPLSSNRVAVPIATVGQPTEYAVLWGLIFVVGILFALGIVGF